MRGVFISLERLVGKAPEEFEFALNLKPVTKPVKQPNRSMHPVIKQELRPQLDELLHKGCIEAQNSPWSSPIVPVQKKDGMTRFCINFRKLNTSTIADNFPLPNIEELLLRMGGGCKIFSSVDAKNAYNCVVVCEVDQQKTAFICAYGL